MNVNHPDDDIDARIEKREKIRENRFRRKLEINKQWRRVTPEKRHNCCYSNKQ